MAMFVAALALVAAGNQTIEPVCSADEPDGLLLLQSGLALGHPLRPRVLSFVQTSGPEAHPQAAGESPGGASVEQQVAEPLSGNVAAGVVEDHVETHTSEVTIVMPPKASREDIVLATTKQNNVQNEGETKFGGHGDIETKEPNKQNDHEDHADQKNGDGKQNTDSEDHDDTSSASGESNQVHDKDPTKTDLPHEIFEIPSDKCQKPCQNGICHDGECFCRYPYVGLQCDIMAISEITKVLAVTMLTGIALFTALCVLVVWRANHKNSAAAPVQEPHMADEEWLPPPPPAEEPSVSPIRGRRL